MYLKSHFSNFRGKLVVHLSAVHYFKGTLYSRVHVKDKDKYKTNTWHHPDDKKYVNIKKNIFIT